MEDLHPLSHLPAGRLLVGMWTHKNIITLAAAELLVFSGTIFWPPAGQALALLGTFFWFIAMHIEEDNE
jgi:hypothetical protein